MASRPPTLSELAGNRDGVPTPSIVAPSKLQEGMKQEKGFQENRGYQPILEEQPTGCGGSTYKALGAFTDTKDVQRNPALSARIDDDFSSCRTPLQVS